LSSTSWRDKPGLLLCPRRQAATPAATTCPRDMKRWLRQNNFPVRELRVRVQKTGFRFPVEWEFEYLCFIYLPEKGETEYDG